jgi:hypothetical protein
MVVIHHEDDDKKQKFALQKSFSGSLAVPDQGMQRRSSSGAVFHGLGDLYQKLKSDREFSPRDTREFEVQSTVPHVSVSAADD